MPDLPPLSRSAIDRGWVLGFLATLFAIHLGRMGLDRTFLAVVSPGVAVLGDLVIAGPDATPRPGVG